MSSGYCNRKRNDSLFNNHHLHDSGIVPNSISNIPSSASNNHLSTATTNTTADRSPYIQTPHTHFSSNVSENIFNTPSSTTTGRYIPPTSRLPPAHYVHSIAKSPSTSIPKNSNNQSYSNQSHSHQSCVRLTHPNQLFSAPHRPPLPSLYTQRGLNAPPSLDIPRARNPPPSLYTQQGLNAPPGLDTQRGQYPTELFTALLYQHECSGCVHESKWPRDFSTHHWPVCPVAERRAVMGWRREENGKESVKEGCARYYQC